MPFIHLTFRIRLTISFFASYCVTTTTDAIFHFHMALILINSLQAKFTKQATERTTRNREWKRVRGKRRHCYVYAPEILIYFFFTSLENHRISEKFGGASFAWQAHVKCITYCYNVSWLLHLVRWVLSSTLLHINFSYQLFVFFLSLPSVSLSLSFSFSTSLPLFLFLFHCVFFVLSFFVSFAIRSKLQTTSIVLNENFH